MNQYHLILKIEKLNMQSKLHIHKNYKNFFTTLEHKMLKTLGLSV